MSKTVLVIGAGMAGLMAATHLTQAGHQVTVVDKARGVGGRMATRRVGAAVCDHGAQYFTARDPRFSAYVQAWQAAGIVQVWSQGFYSWPDGISEKQEARYRGVGGMTAIAKHLTQTLTVQTEQKITHINQSQTAWEAHSETGQHYQAEALVISAPVEQALALIHSGNYRLPDSEHQALQAVAYAPCFAVMAQLDRPSQIPAPGGLWVNSPNIHWLADNQQKGISESPSITLHASAKFTRQHWDRDPQAVADVLLAEVHPWLGQAQVIASSIQRWRYSQPTTLYPDPCLGIESPAPVVFVGDAFGGSRVEGAALSGLAGSDWLLGLKEN
jgi:hypothetical protein